MTAPARQPVIVIAGKRCGELGTIAGTLADRSEFVEKVLVKFEKDGVVPVKRGNLREATALDLAIIKAAENV